ncbi:MAG: DNA2/NAM7 family helicase, partial [Thermoguttaceae bacterium]|nr:DNA2/NAM7 family helicase [Thermoguttaceae bacterium]
ERENSETFASVSLGESAAQADAREFDEVWTRFEEERAPFLRTFVAWKDDFERSQRDVASTLQGLDGRLGDLANSKNGRVDVDALSNALAAGDKAVEVVRATLGGANEKNIPRVLDFLGKQWRSVLEEGAEKGVALRRWLDSWTRLEERIEEIAARLNAWQNERCEQKRTFEELSALYRSRFDAARPNDWRDLDNAIDVGDLVFQRVDKLWGVEIERESLIGERFWRDLSRLWSELSDETSAVCGEVARCCAAWEEYPERLAAFVEALNATFTIEGGDSEIATNRTFNVVEALPTSAGDAKDGADEKADGAQLFDLNVFIDWVYRFALAQVESLRIENELGTSASVLWADGRRDVDVASQTVDELAEFDRKICAWKFPLNVDVLRDRVGAALATSFENGSKALFAERSAAVREDWNEFCALQRRFDALTTYRGAAFDDSKTDAYLANRRLVAERALRCENVFQYWNNWNRMQVKLTQYFPELVEAIRKREIADADVAPILQYLLFARFADEVVDASERLRLFVGSERDRQVERFREFDERRAELSKLFVVSELARRSPKARIEEMRFSVAEAEAWTFLQREMGLKRHARSIRQILDAIQPILPTLKPCLLMSPLSVAQYMPADGAKRDVVIFDEASQMPVWDAVGAIARGSQLIVVGDSKQLPPTSFFQRRLDEEELGEDEVEETESILDECVAAQIPTTMLTWHYRSRRESLIAFSNRRYYDGKLQTFPAPKDDALGVRFRYVADGVYEKGGSKTNKPEAKALVNDVIARLRSPSFKGKSLGVVTFNEAQKHLIEDLLDDARRKYPEIEVFFDESAFEPVFVKNLENVQGDERDVIYFSICYGPDAKGAISMNFGPLNV